MELGAPEFCSLSQDPFRRFLQGWAWGGGWAGLVWRERLPGG